MTVALDASDRAGLDDLLQYQLSLGLGAERRSASECRRLIPALSPAVRGGIEVSGDHQVDNRALLGALVAACRHRGVAFLSTRVAGVAPGPELVLGDGRRVGSDVVVLAAGVGMSALGGLEGAGIPPVRPVKGHILRLGPADEPVAGRAPLLGRTVRGLVHGRSVYLVPRRNGSVVVGATVEERGVDIAVRAGAVHDLLCDARAIVPGIDEMELHRVRHGPATGHPRQHALHRMDRARGSAGGDRSLSQRHPPGSAHRGGRRRPGGAPARRAPHRGAGTGVTTYALRVNGNLLEVELGASIADVVVQLTGEEDPRGVAVAVDRCVVPRSEWATTLARPDSLVEVVGATAGG